MRAARPTVGRTGASQFRRVLQDIGRSDHPKRIRHSEWLEASLTLLSSSLRYPVNGHLRPGILRLAFLNAPLGGVDQDSGPFRWSLERGAAEAAQV